MYRPLAALALGVLASACGSSSLRGAGEECVSSSQCGPGLVCDFGVEPHVCAGMGTPIPDAPSEPTPDSPPAPDADPNQPDSPPGQPDARPADAPPATPDARPPDAPVPDASIDA